MLTIPQDVEKSMPPEAFAVFRDAAEIHMVDGTDVHATLKAYRAVENAGYIYDGSVWVAKDVMTVGDVHADGPLSNLTEAFPQGKKKKPKRKDDPGTEDVDVEDLNKIDAVSMDVPLLLRLLEVAREEIEMDEPLHFLVEQLTECSSMLGRPLTMDDYDSIVSVLKGGGYVCFDLDKTLAYYDGDLSKVGEPLDGPGTAFERAKRMVADGKDVRIFTARIHDDPGGKQREMIEAWSKKYLGKALPITNVKTPDMVEFWDDRAHAVEPNTGVEKYSPDQERDDHGRFGEGGDTTLGDSSKETRPLVDAIEAAVKDHWTDYDTIAIRAQSGAEQNTKVGSTLRPSSEWVDGTKTRNKLPGTAGFEVRRLDDVKSVVEAMQRHGYVTPGNRLVVIGTNDRVNGADMPERYSAALENAKLVAVIGRVLSDGNVKKGLDDPANRRYINPKYRVSKIEKRISGLSSIPLNDKGKKLAKRLGERLALKGSLDILYSSPLPRATQTADAIVEAAPNPEEIYRAKPAAALEPWDFPEIKGKSSADVQDLIAHYVKHPDEVPEGGESFDDAKTKLLEFFERQKADFDEQPTLKIGIVMHGRGMETLQAWVDAGCPRDYSVDVKDLLHPDDPDHATVLRWHKDAIKKVDLEDDDPLKPGIYLILHSLTDDDTDEGNEDLEKAEVQVRKYLPPTEVAASARSAWEAGISVIDITETLALNEGLPLEEVQKIDAHFADVAWRTEQVATTNAWGGKRAGVWAARVLRKVEKYSLDMSNGQKSIPILDSALNEVDKMELVAKAGNGVMLAFWPSEELAKKLAVEGGEDANQLHVTLAYFGGLDDVELDSLPVLEDAVERFASSHTPVKATLGGLGRFPATLHSDGLDVMYLGVHSDAIQEFRQELVDAVEAAGCEPKKNFGYTPHMTLMLIEPDESNEYPEIDEPEPVDVTFDKITLSIGNASKEYELTGEPVEKIEDFEMSGDVIKVDAVQHLVFGIFSLISIDGKPVTDTQGDRITQETLERAVYDYVLHARKGGEMHKVDAIGQLVESMVITPEKQKALLSELHKQGIDAVMDLKCVMWWGGFHITDEETWQKIVSGELKAFSIGGRGKRAVVDE